jgi:hypothetical protein
MLLLLAACTPSAGGMSIVAGAADVIDGDTVVVAGRHVRLKGVDAPETWMTGGPEATAAMRAIVGDWLSCDLTGEKTWRRDVGFCRNAQGQDIGEEIIRGGWALACPHYSVRYVEFEQPEARAIALAVLALTSAAHAQAAPLGWVFLPYTQCMDPPRCSMGVVSVQADGLNVRVAPDGASPAVMALTNGTPFYPVDKQGNWLLAVPACDLTPTFAWSWTAGVPLARCWVYFP